MSARSQSRPSESIILHLLAYIPVGGLLGIAASWRVVVVGFDVVFAFSLGVIVALCASPFTYIITRNRSALQSFMCIFAPAFVVAVTSSDPYDPLRSLVYTLAAFVASLVLCMAIVPAVPQSGKCLRCHYSTKGIASPRCPECGHDLSNHSDVHRITWLDSIAARSVIAVCSACVIIIIMVYSIITSQNVAGADDGQLMNMLASRQMQLRAEATYELTRRPRETILKALDDERDRVRYNAVRALGMIGDDWAINRLVERHENDESLRVRSEAQQWLDRHGRDK
jgi:hypothetical protein